MHLVEAGKNLIYIRDFLGHESIETTQVYAKANPEARRKALETMDTRMNTPAMPDWNDDPDLKAFFKDLVENYAEISGEQSRSNVCSKRFSA